MPGAILKASAYAPGVRKACRSASLLGGRISSTGCGGAIVWSICRWED